jgi:hypothetical protein
MICVTLFLSMILFYDSHEIFFCIFLFLFVNFNDIIERQSITQKCRIPMVEYVLNLIIISQLPGLTTVRLWVRTPIIQNINIF